MQMSNIIRVDFVKKLNYSKLSILELCNLLYRNNGYEGDKHILNELISRNLQADELQLLNKWIQLINIRWQTCLKN